MALNITAPYELTKKAVSNLPQKMRDVIARRFGLKSGKKETLESIGRSYGITRERVRQIEENVLMILRRPENVGQFAEAFKFIKNHIDDHGKLRRESALLQELTSVCYPLTGNGKLNYGAKYCSSALLLMMAIGDEFERRGDTKNFYPLWTIDRKSLSEAESTVGEIAKFLEKIKNPLPEAEILEFAEGRFNVPAKVVLSYIDVSKNIERNIFGEWGLAHWPQVTPRGVRDKAYLVFRREKKPLHFTEVSSHINDYKFSSRRAYPQTVHNELIKDERFVLIGRGIYALSEWGYTAGTVGEVIAGILKKAGRPMERGEIVDEVLKKRLVKANTIILNLQNKDRFAKLENGGYVLKN